MAEFDALGTFEDSALEQMITDPTELSHSHYNGISYSIQESGMSPMLQQQYQYPTQATQYRGIATSARLPPTPSSSGQRRRQDQSASSTEPRVEIIEQPKQRGLRFRYQCEGRSAGSIPGEHSTNEKKTYPSIKIHNYKGPAIIVVSCVTKDPEPQCKPHPHSLVGRDCKKGVCTVKVKDSSVVSFPQLGIQCAKKKDVEGALALRKEINVDPYQTGFDHANANIDLNVVRLCFQVFLPDTSGKVTRVVPPVVSHCIHDKKALNDLIICRIDRSSGKARGGDEVFLLCEKVGKDDIKVRFFEEENGEVTWEGFGDFGQGDVHRQYAIVFKTPKYKEEYITRPVIVYMQLLRPSDQEGSEPIQFTYMPEDPDPDRIEEKRKRKGDWLNKVMPSSGSSDGLSSSNSSVKESLRHKLKANRRIKQETNMEAGTSGLALGQPSIPMLTSGSSVEPLSSTSSASVNFRTPDNTTMSKVFVAQPTQPTEVINVDTSKLAQGLVLQQHDTSGVPISGVSGGSSQPGSLDSLLSFITSMPGTAADLLSAAALQSLLDQGASFSSASDNGVSSNLMDMTQEISVALGHNLPITETGGVQELSPQQQLQFIEAQQALEALNKSVGALK